MTVREFNLLIHRYLGLFTAIFLIITSVTGSILAFKPTLDDWFNHKLAYVEPSSQPYLPIAVLHDKVVASYPQSTFSSMPVSIKPNRSVMFSVDKQSTKNSVNTATPSFHNVYINPYTGAILGTRNFDDWAWHNTMSKVFWLHRNLLLGDTGKMLLGISALLWTINCLVGLYLTFPRAKTANKKAKKTTTKTAEKNTKNQPSAIIQWLQQWQRAWKIRKFSSWFKLNFDLHHAFGLWFWLISLIIAWSSVAFNLPAVYKPVMQAVTGLKPPQPQTKSQPMTISTFEKNLQVGKQPQLQIDKYHAIDTLTHIANTQSQLAGKQFEQPLGIRWLPKEQAWQMRFTTTEDFGTGRGASSVTVNAITGKVEKINFGSTAKFGNKLDHIILSLHTAHINSLLYRVFLSVFGIIVLVLCITGLYLWWRGKQARQKLATKKQATMQLLSH